jgi:hypothetical protein
MWVVSPSTFGAGGRLGRIVAFGNPGTMGNTSFLVVGSVLRA